MEQRSIVQESEISFGPAPNVVTRLETDKQLKHKLIKQQQEKQQVRKVNNPIMDHSIDKIRNLLTCSLTHAIVTDPGKL
jgi:hypothetical protein